MESDQEILQRRLAALCSHLSLNNNIETENCSAKLNEEKDNLFFERKRKSFDVKELRQVLFGGPDKVKIWQDIYKMLEKEELFTNHKIEDLTHEEYREFVMERIKRLLDMELHKLDMKSIAILGKILYMIDPSTSVRLGVHTNLFMQSISGNGTEYHKKKYFKPATRGRIFGCFGMTELGHGSNAGGLETTATFDKKTQEFIIDSPTITATKWWIGGAAETATHCAVFARLIIADKDYGVHSFVVQLRDVETHKPREGVTIGDCGIKLGMNGIDNGFLRFDKVRIPREDMLDQYARVNQDGSYWKAGKSALALQRVALVGARTGIVGQSSLDGMMALTIAIRYSAVRTQFEAGPGKPERQILDYQTQMYRLFLPLADILSLQFTSLSLEESYNTLLEELHTGNMNNLGDVHAIAAGMKAFSTWTARDTLTICRDCLGGHGYSAYNRLARMIKDFQVQTTWDGDNTVLSQQTAKYLIGSLQKVFEGKKLKGSVRYLEEATTILSSQLQINDESDLLETDIQVGAFRWRTTNLAASCATKMQQFIANGKDAANAWNDNLVDLIALAKAHCDLYKLESFITAIKRHELSKTSSKPVIEILKTLCSLYALSNIEKDMGTFRDNDYITSDQARLIKQQVRKICYSIRPEAISIIDSFSIPDYVVDSQVGRYDGDIYTKYFDRVKQAQKREVPVYWDKFIKPLTNAVAND